ncbi:MAG: hypothetical protein EBZ48_14230, partial [Proteobacteria bacterium]|nr:hypothetical protein [Pseudomonadota bacterium]
MARIKKPAPEVGTLRSMTGFGVGRATTPETLLEVEIKSANSRFLDLVVRLPRVFAHLEADIRSELSSELERGRVEVVVNRTRTHHRPVSVKLNRKALESFSEIYRAVGKQIGASAQEIRASIFSHVLTRPEVLEVEDQTVDLAAERVALEGALRQAVRGLQQMRQREGKQLVGDLRRRVRRLAQLRSEIRRFVARRPEATRERLLAAIKRLSPDLALDQQRLHTEVVLLADRVDVTEEVVR